MSQRLKKLTDHLSTATWQACSHYDQLFTFQGLGFNLSVKDADHHYTSVIAPYGTHASPRSYVWWNLYHRMSDDVTSNENEIEIAN